MLSKFRLFFFHFFLPLTEQPENSQLDSVQQFIIREQFTSDDSHSDPHYQPPPSVGTFPQAAAPPKSIMKIKLRFEEKGVFRRAALGLLPDVNDPELSDDMTFSPLKSSRSYRFLNDNLSVTLEGGYRLCRCKRSLQLDKPYYWEMIFSSAKTSESHIRVGIATIKADMEAPVGVDNFGYCVGDLGKCVHNGWENKEYKSPKFGVGDTIGFGFIPGPESISVKVFINGVDHGFAFTNVDRTMKWFPAVSIYRDAVVSGVFERPFRYDPGPEFASPKDLPKERARYRIHAKDLVKIMKTYSELSQEDRDKYIKAIDVALTPAHQMPI